MTAVRLDGASAFAKAGLVAAVLWVVGIGARMGFALWVGHGGQAAVARFSVLHHITSGSAWGAAFVLMAMAEVASRTGVLYLKTRRIGCRHRAWRPAPPAGGGLSPEGRRDQLADGIIVSVGVASQLRAQLGTRTERMLSAARLAALVGLLWATAHQVPPKGVPADHPAKWVLMGTAASAGWAGWPAAGFGPRVTPRGASSPSWPRREVPSPPSPPLPSPSWPSPGSVPVSPSRDCRRLGVGAIGVGALAVATAAVGAPAVLVAEGAVSAVVGLMVGASRRQYVERTLQAEELLAERVRADTERDRAAALAERNRIGREVHDVLAHSLGALSVQLDAADALLENGSDDGRARQLIQQARRLAVQGLEDTRQAVHALRDEPVALAEQLSSLAARDGAELTVTGAPRPLPADAGLALYRAAQEAVTNARKHAPGAPVSIRLDFEPKTTTLRVANGRCPDATITNELQTTGGGFGLQGMRERIELLGGQVDTEPTALGWTVQVAVPV